MNQASLFDFQGRVVAPAKPLGQVKRDEGMARAEAHAPEGWAAEAERAVLAVAEVHDRFTSDEVWATGLQRPSEPRALGPVLMSLARRGLIEAVGFRQTTQASRNAAPVREWRRVAR